MGHYPGNYKKNPKGSWQPGDPLTEEDLALLQSLKEVARERGHSPRIQDVPNSAALKNRFGVWKNVLTAANLPLYTAHEQVTLRRMAEDRLAHEQTSGQIHVSPTDTEIIQIALDEGFSAAALIPTSDIVFDASFRPYCEENLCGCYGANYSCPPDCGTPEEMERRIRSFDRALVLQTKWDIQDYSDSAAIKAAKRRHNAAMLRVLQRLQAEGLNGLMAGASCCMLCERCAILDGAPCCFPSRCYSCLSAYCIYVKKLAERCDMEYTCADGMLAFFGLYAF